MLKTKFEFFYSLLKKQRAIDYKMMGVNRKRLFDIPSRTNYIRINTFELLAIEIIEKKVDGSIAELGVYTGDFARYMNMAFPEKKFYLFDTFEGFDDRDIKIEKTNSFRDVEDDFSNTSTEAVLSKMKTRENCIVKKGWFPESLNGLEDKFCFVSLDADLYKPIYSGLEYFYPRLSKGGYILVDDYNNDLYPGCKQAVREFCSKNFVPYTPMSDPWGSVIIAK